MLRSFPGAAVQWALIADLFALSPYDTSTLSAQPSSTWRDSWGAPRTKSCRCTPGLVIVCAFRIIREFGFAEVLPHCKSL